MSLHVVLTWWDRLTSTQPAPPAWLVAASAAAALVIVVNVTMWHLARNAITIAHEGGHALVSLLTGRRLDGIRLHADTSGVTYSRGRRTGPGIVLTSAAGYVAPPLLGTGAAVLLASRHLTAMLWLMLALLIATFLAIRNAYGVLAVGVSAALVIAVTWYASATVQAAFGYTTAWFLLLGGVRPVFELHADRRGYRGGTSDADHLARLTGMPGGVWVTFFALVALVALVFGGRLLLPQHLITTLSSYARGHLVVARSARPLNRDAVIATDCGAILRACLILRKGSSPAPPSSRCERRWRTCPPLWQAAGSPP